MEYIRMVFIKILSDLKVCLSFLMNLLFLVSPVLLQDKLRELAPNGSFLLTVVRVHDKVK